MCAHVLVLLAAAFPGATMAAPVAPAAASRQVEACSARRTADAKTAQIATKVSGTIGLGGCIADGATGVAHAYLEWERGTSHGRICTDPVVFDIAWSCTWDTARLRPGKYLVRFVAVDGAGNRGSFERRYTVVRAAAPTTPALPPSNPTESAPPPSPEMPAASPEQPLKPVQPAPELPSTATPPPAPAPTTEQLAADRIHDCDIDKVGAAPTNDPAVTSQLDQAAAVRTCIEPALRTLGAARIDIDAIPVPPALIIWVHDVHDVKRLMRLLPPDIAGVPLRVTVEPDLGRTKAA